MEADNWNAAQSAEDGSWKALQRIGPQPSSAAH